MVGGEGFEPPNSKEVGYSHPHLAALLPPLRFLNAKVLYYKIPETLRIFRQGFNSFNVKIISKVRDLVVKPQANEGDNQEDSQMKYGRCGGCHHNWLSGACGHLLNWFGFN